MMIIVRVNRKYFSDFVERNDKFIKKVNKYNREMNQHQRVMDISQQQANKFVDGLSKQQISAKMIKDSKYDKQFSDFISDFNRKHKGQTSLLDFSNYATSFGQLRDGPIKKSDLQVIQQFQKRKIDQRVHDLRKIKIDHENNKLGLRKKKLALETHEEDPDGHQNSGFFPFTKPDDKGSQDLNDIDQPISFASEGLHHFKNNELRQGPFYLKDNFMMLLLHRGISTKVTTLNRLNYYRTLVFMGNGNGVISYGRARSENPQGSLLKAIDQCKSNIIAIPMDDRCTLPKPINKRHQDYRLYLRPLPGFNSWGHPTMASMLALAGFSHLGFKTVHTSKNVYDLLNVFFKTVTKNTTPQQLAEQQGYKVYRHQFIRPLTTVKTHGQLSR